MTGSSPTLFSAGIIRQHPHNLHCTYHHFSSGRGLGVPHIVSHLVTNESLDVLSFDSVSMFTVHRLPGGVMKPGSSHNIQSYTGPVDRVALPLLQIHFVYSSPHHDEEVSLIPNQLSIWSVVTVLTKTLSGRNILLNSENYFTQHYFNHLEERLGENFRLGGWEL